MIFIWLTGPDGIRCVVNAEHISAMAPAEKNGVEMTRIDWVAEESSFVKETIDQIWGFIDQTRRGRE